MNAAASATTSTVPQAADPAFVAFASALAAIAFGAVSEAQAEAQATEDRSGVIATTPTTRAKEGCGGNGASNAPTL